MARLPNPGGDNGTWGVILNDFLAVAHDSTGALLANSIPTTALQDDAVNVDKIATTNSPSTNQALIYNGTAMQWANLEPFQASGTTSQYLRGDKTWQTLDKTAVGLANVDNTSDVNKPISTATQTALNARVQFRDVTTATAAATAAKTATVAGYTPTAGDFIRLIFTLGNSASSATLAINAGTAYPLRIANAAATNVAATTAANGFLFVYFDGSAYHLFGSSRNSDTDTNTTYMASTTFSTIATTTQTAAVNTGYVTNNAAQVNVTLPATAAVGSIVEVFGLGAGGWRVTAAAGDNIILEGNDSGAAGYITGGQYTAVLLRCIVANTTWTVGSNSGVVTSNTGYSTSRLLDEDAMTSNSATIAPSQQSVKAYVDAADAGKANVTHTHAFSDITSGSVASTQLPDATIAAKGAVTLATEEEVITGTNTTKAVTPAGVSAIVNAVSNPIVFVNSLDDIPPGTPVDTLVVVRAQ